MELFTNSSQGILIVVLLSRDLHLEGTVCCFTCGDTREFQVYDVLDLFTLARIVGAPLVASHQLEFEILDVFFALCIVCDDANLCSFSEIVLVLVEENL